MRLGILVNSDKNLEDLKGIVKAASGKGHEVEVFAMDIGTKLLEDPSFLDLKGLSGVTMGFCDFSSKSVEANTENISEDIKRADQWTNSIMMHNADKVIIL